MDSLLRSSVDKITVAHVRLLFAVFGSKGCATCGKITVKKMQKYCAKCRCDARRKAMNMKGKDTQ